MRYDSRSALDVWERTDAMLGLARTVSARGRQREADSLALSMLHMNERAFGSSSWEMAHPLHALKEYYEFACQDSMAALCSAKLDRIYKEYPDEGPLGLPDETAGLLSEGQRHLREGHLELAQDAFDKAVAAQQHAFGPDDSRVYETRHWIAEALAASGNLDQSMVLFCSLQARTESKIGRDRLELIDLLAPMAAIEASRGRYSEAEAILSRIVALQEAHLGRDRAELIPTLRSLAGAQASQGHYEDALRTRQRALAITSRLCDQRHPQRAIDLMGIAIIEAKLGHVAEARNACSAAKEIFTRSLGPEERQTIECHQLMDELATQGAGHPVHAS